MKAIQSQRGARASRNSRPFRADLAVALLALLAQIASPHLHRLQIAAHAETGATPRLAASMPAIGVAHGALHHVEARCPVCQALSASHDFLVAASYQPASATAAIVSRPLLDARTTHAPVRAHAPRSPPLAV